MSRRLFMAGAILLLVQLLALSAFIVDPNVGVWAADVVAPVAVGALVCLVVLGGGARR